MQSLENIIVTAPFGSTLWPPFGVTHLGAGPEEWNNVRVPRQTKESSYSYTVMTQCQFSLQQIPLILTVVK